MKNLSLFVSAFALCASTSYAAIDCASLPNCGDLGYSDTVAECPKSVNGEEMVIRCPFDAGKADKEAKGKCIYEAAVGQIGYFTKTLHASSGWLLCDGKSYSYTKYPQLAKLIGTQFGGTVNNTFVVPDYRGFFLRVYAGGTSSSYVRSDFTTYSGDVNTSFTSPQKEGLPNIRGKFEIHGSLATSGDAKIFNTTASWAGNGGLAGGGLWKESGYGGVHFTFAASKASSIYGRPNTYDTDTMSHVIPANMAVHAYIYAGKIVQ